MRLPSRRNGQRLKFIKIVELETAEENEILTHAQYHISLFANHLDALSINFNRWLSYLTSTYRWVNQLEFRYVKKMNNSFVERIDSIKPVQFVEWHLTLPAVVNHLKNNFHASIVTYRIFNSMEFFGCHEKKGGEHPIKIFFSNQSIKMATIEVLTFVNNPLNRNRGLVEFLHFHFFLWDKEYKLFRMNIV